MQVTETLSEGLKRAYTVVVPAADIETKRAARLREPRQDAGAAGLPAGQGPADAGPPALWHGGDRRGRWRNRSAKPPAGAERARPAARRSNRRWTSSASTPAAAGAAKGPGVQGRTRTAAGDHSARLQRDQPNAHEGRGVAGDGGQGVGGHRPAQPGAGGDNCRGAGRSRCGGG